MRQKTKKMRALFGVYATKIFLAKQEIFLSRSLFGPVDKDVRFDLWSSCLLVMSFIVNADRKNMRSYQSHRINDSYTPKLVAAFCATRPLT